MKRSLILVPFIFLAILSACGGNTNIPIAAWTAMAQTLTATALPPTFTPTITPDPNELLILESLNAGGLQYEWDWNNQGGQSNLATRLDQLEDTIGADFQILDVRFPIAENGLAMVFQVYARCECATNGPCCTPEHMFVMTMRNLYMAVQQPQQTSIVFSQIPTTVDRMEVLCFDHQNQMAVMSVAWQDVRSFLNGEINGLQLGTRVTRQ